MLAFKQFIRHLHVNSIICASEKSGLAILRKKTGYTFANCKKALELHNNDLVKAEKWLTEQAQSLGWSKATKLEGRSTTQGLIGVLINQQNIGAMVEVNCETDFVARNQSFRDFVESVTMACCNHVANMPINDNILSKIEFDGETLKQILGSDGKTLNDHLALMIGKVGENGSLRRATCFKATSSLTLTGFAHPAQPTSNTSSHIVQLGKFGSIIAFSQKENTAEASRVTDNSSDIQKNLCQHIVGMNPKKIKPNETDEPAANKDDEVCLTWQEYLLEPTMTVAEVLEENHLEVVDFLRYECGEVSIKEDAPDKVAASNASA